MSMTMMLKSVAVCRDLARARRVYADDDTVEVVDKGSVERAFVDYSWTCCPSSKNSPESLDYPRFET